MNEEETSFSGTEKEEHDEAVANFICATSVPNPRSTRAYQRYFDDATGASGERGYLSPEEVDRLLGF